MSRKLSKIIFSFFLVVFAFGVSGCSKKVETKRVVRIAIQPSAAFIPLYVARYSGAIDASLAQKNVKVVWQDFESGPPMNESLSADMSDIGVIGDVPTVVALAGSTRMKMVGVPARGPDAYALLARSNDKTFNAYKDLKGKRVATVFGSTGHNFTKKLLEKAGLSFSDIEFSNIAASDAALQLRSGAVDAVVIWEPNVTRLIESGDAKVISYGSDTNLRGTNAFVVREEFLTENPEVIKEILVQYDKAVDSLETLDESTLNKLGLALHLKVDQVKSVVKKYNYSVCITDEDVALIKYVYKNYYDKSIFDIFLHI